MENSVAKINFEDIKKNKEKYAKEFSEGNSDLESCLLKLWNNDICTVGCCIGHGISSPYIAFELNYNVDSIKKILNNIIKENIRLNFTCNEFNKTIGIKSIDSNDFSVFKKIYAAIDKDINSDNYDLEINKCLSWDSGYYNSVYYYNKDNKRVIVTNNIDEINNLKNKYKYDLINKKINLYQFYIN